MAKADERKQTMKNQNIILTTILLTLGCFAFPPGTQAVSPPPDGGYPGQNTAEGQSALLHLAGGTYNTALGWASLGFNVTGNFNTGVGAATLLNNTGDNNTATGVGALLSNTTGNYNTANGVFALSGNTQGHDNAATGDYALYNNSSGSNNTASGRVALYANTIGDGNAAYGDEALDENTTGSNNTAIGNLAGKDLTTGDNNIDIGYNVLGIAGESNTIRIGNTDINTTIIRGISGQTIPSGATVIVASNGQLGTMTSSKRFKQDIKPMDKASEALLQMKPVTFRYKNEIDPIGTSQFGLVAEEVAKINPDLVVRDEARKPYSVRYDQVNAKLLNEFLKEHKKVEKLEATVAQQQTSFQSRLAEQEMQIQTLVSGLQKISARVEMSKPATKVASNHP
jgi:hypothetical protein